ncbi:signal recognition particle 19 kda protein, putative, partial [Ichthyophthirius multifiliis]
MMSQQEMIQQSKTWKTIYPQYLDSLFSRQEGRRISKDQGVPNINIKEIAEALQKIRVPTVVEVHKSYPRSFQIKGRVKVMLKDEDKKLVNPIFKSKKQLYLRICQEIKQTSERQQNPIGKPHPSRAILQDESQEQKNQ